MHRLRNRGVRRTFQSTEHRFSPSSLAIEKAIPDIFIQNVFKWELIDKNLASVTSVLSI